MNFLIITLIFEMKLKAGKVVNFVFQLSTNTRKSFYTIHPMGGLDNVKLFELKRENHMY